MRNNKCLGAKCGSMRGYFTRIAALTGYSRQHVSKVLRGKGSYSDTSLALIAQACDVDIGWLAVYIECQR